MNEEDPATMRTRQHLGELLELPKDMARWGFWVPFRNTLDPERPETLSRLWPLWRALYGAGGAQRRLMTLEYEQIFPHATSAELGGLLREAYRVAFRVHLEELLMGRLTRETVDLHLDVQGREHLERALDRGKGVIILSAHAGSFMLPIAWFSLHGYAYSQYAARGMPPEDLASVHAGTLRVNRWQRAARRAREDNEDRLPASFLTMETPVRDLYRRLARNELVALAFDGRLGSSFVRTAYLGRQALLSTGPYRLAASTGAAILPTLCRTPPDGPSVCRLGPPLFPDGRGWRSLMGEFVTDHADPWIRSYPEEYGTWLAHCRPRGGLDDHPHFVDYAVDRRWRRWPVLPPPRASEPEPGARHQPEVGT